MTSSHDLMKMLRASMHAPSRPSPGYVVGELEAPNALRRADALFIPLGHARRGQIHGYEFKISRSDLITELNDPMKADPWLRYCTTWHLFVSDPLLIAGLDIPDAWGILAPPSGRNLRALTVLRKAPTLEPVQNMQPAWLAIIARLYYGGEGITDERFASLQANLESAHDAENSQRRRAEAAEQKLRQLDPTERDPHKDLVWEIVGHLKNRWLHPDPLKVIDPARIAELLTDVAALEALRDQLAASADTDLKDLERVHEQRGNRIKTARQTLDRTMKGGQ